MTNIPVKIASIAYAVPDRIITNDDLTKILDTSDEWITTRTGIKERRVVDGNDNATTLAVQAAKACVSKAKISPDEIDAIIVASSNPYNIYPSTACVVQAEIGAKSAPAFDVSAACTGMLYAMEIGRNFIRTGAYKNVLLVSSDTNSKFVDWEDRATCVLFGDGAASILLSTAEDGIDDIIALDITSNGTLGKHITMHLDGDNCPLAQPNSKQTTKIKMNGKEVYKFVVTTMPNSIEKCLEHANLTPKDIDYLIPHQANLRIIEGLQQRLNYDDNKVIVNIDKYGNTSASSVPIALCEALEEGKIKTPSKAILCAFGAGMTWGSAIVRLREDLK